MQKQWNDVYDFFQFLNKNTEYVILRNWERYPSEALLSGKEDIDVLCSDKTRFIDEIGGIPCHHSTKRCNYYVVAGDRRIRIDIRYLGDGYYCREWEKRLLERRIYSDQGFYVLNSEDYYFSLLYHALIQKPELSQKYFEKLNAMADEGKKAKNEEEFLYLLNRYMKENHFFVEIPVDYGVILNRHNIREGNLALKRNIYREFFRKTFRIKNKVLRLHSKLKGQR